MATIRPRRTSSGKPRWFVEVRLKGHPTVRNTLSTKGAASEWAKNIEVEIRTGRLPPVIEASKHTLAEAIARYTAEHERIPSRLPWWGQRYCRVVWRPGVQVLDSPWITAQERHRGPPVLAGTRDVEAGNVGLPGIS